MLQCTIYCVTYLETFMLDMSETKKDIDFLQFNTLMPETGDNVICYMVDKPISAKGYELQFVPLIESILQKYDTIKILIYFKDYKGWEEQAAIYDMQAHLNFGSKLSKLAIVNPHQKELSTREIKQHLIKGETKFFDESELQTAIDWVKQGQVFIYLDKS